MYPFAARSRANGPSKPLQTHFGYARGMRGPREWRTPQSGSRQAVWKSMLVQNGYARGYAHYIYLHICGQAEAPGTLRPFGARGPWGAENRSTNRCKNELVRGPLSGAILGSQRGPKGPQNRPQEPPKTLQPSCCRMLFPDLFLLQFRPLGTSKTFVFSTVVASSFF